MHRLTPRRHGLPVRSDADPDIAEALTRPLDDERRGHMAETPPSLVWGLAACMAALAALLAFGR